MISRPCVLFSVKSGSLKGQVGGLHFTELVLKKLGYSYFLQEVIVPPKCIDCNISDCLDYLRTHSILSSVL